MFRNFSRIAVLSLACLVMSDGISLAAKGAGAGSAARQKTIVRLSRTAAAPTGASGKAVYETRSVGREKFGTEAQGLTPLNGMAASVYVNGVLVGSRQIALGRFNLELESERGQSVPVVSSGTRVEIQVGGAVILAGEF